ncbi:MAG: hypothetical protein AB1631_05060 [Acidobacteriota bacterium]
MKRLFQNRSTRYRRIILIFTLAITLALPSVEAAPGGLDASFNSPNGFATLPDSFFTDVAIQPDSKVLAVGQKEDKSEPGDTSRSLIVARFNTDGTLDASFSTNGVATPVSSDEVVGAAIAVQPDGKIVAAGFTHPLPGGFFVTRFLANGEPDAGFGQMGSVTINFGGALEGANSIAIGSDGTIVVAGSSVFGAVDSNPMTFIAIARLLGDGNLDPAFGSGGKILAQRGNATDVAVLGDGRILASGLVPDTLPTDFALLRFNSDGTPDVTFAGGDGIATADFRNQDISLDMAVQPDGRVVLAGSALNPGEPSSDALARFDSNGNLDPSFDGDGKVIAPPSADTLNATGVAIQSDGGIVTVGSVNIGSMSEVFCVVSRYTSNGSPDLSFGSGGRVVTDFPGKWATSGGGAIQSDGKILLVGAQTDQGQLFGLVARFLGNGAPPPPPPPVFDICLQTNNGNSGKLVFKFNSATGAYEFRDCAKGFVLTGTGTITVNFCKLDLTDVGPVKPSDRTVTVQVNTCTKKATVSVTIKSPSKMYGFTDNDITQGSCTCP